MEKTPCIKINEKTWNKIIPYLKEWGYTPNVGAGCYINVYNLLILDSNNTFGIYDNIHTAARYDKELITNVEEFLEKAAKLKGFTYKKNMKKEFTKNDLQLGMVVEYRKGEKRIVLEFNSQFYLSGDTEFGELSSFNDDLSNKFYKSLDIIKVYKITKPSSLSHLMNNENNSDLELIWERDETKEYTMQEIANKLGIPVEQLRIKK